MTAYPGHLDDVTFGGVHISPAGRAAAAFTRAPAPLQAAIDTAALDDPVVADDHASVPYRPAVSPSDYPAHLGIEMTPGRDWFEKLHVVPRSINFGNILATIEEVFEIYNAYRMQNVSLTTFTNDVDSGTDVTDLPSLPHTLGAQNSLVLTCETTQTAIPSFAGNLEFDFDVGTAYLYISGIRLVLWYFNPESPITERLGWVTDVEEGRTGIEQRIAVRKSPKQRFSARYRLDGQDRRQARMYLMDWQNQLFGLPVWNQQVALTASATAGAFSVSTTTNSYSDFRVGGQATIFTGRDTYDVLVVASMTATSITFATALQNSYPAGTPCAPVRTVEVESVVGGDQHRINLEDIEATFDVQDTDVDLADTSAFSSYNSKVILDDCNPVFRTVRESFETRVYILDSVPGTRTRTSLWPNMKRGHVQTLVGRSRQAAWQLRQLLYALRGRQVSFYTLTYSDDILVTGTLTATQALMDIENIGFTRFSQKRNPMRHIRLTFTDGSVLLREVTDAVEIDTDTERLTVDSAWPSTKLPSEVSRVEFVELVRFDSDEIEIEHTRPDYVRAQIPVRSLIESS